MINKKFIFSYKGYIIFTWIASLIEVYTLINNIQNGEYKYLYLLPISYSIAVSIFLPLIKKHCKYDRGVIYYLLQFVLAYRYLALPLACMYTDINGGWTASGTSGFGVDPSVESMFAAILWMCSEIFAAELAIYISMRIIVRMEKKRLSSDEKQEYNFLQNKAIIILFCFCSFFLLIAAQPQLFSQFMVLSDDFSVGSNAADGSFFKLIFIGFKFGFLMLGYAYCAKKYKKKKSYIWLIIAMFILVIYLGYSIGASRWSLILPAVASVIIFRKFFDIPKIFIAIIATLAFIGMINITYFKYGYLLDNANVFDLLLIVFQQSNEYISGPRSIAQGIEMLSAYRDNIGISTFFNSIFSGFAGFASSTNNYDKLQSFFNYYNLGIAFEDKPLICPILIEGMAFFPIYPWIFLSIFIISACVLDYKSAIEMKGEKVFLMLYLGLWFALCLNGNTKTEMAQISQLIPCFILFAVNNIIKIKF